jgi:hypothetical protein
MFIARGTENLRRRSEGRNSRFDLTHLVSFRPSERRTVFCFVPFYKHLTPTEWHPNGVKPV